MSQVPPDPPTPKPPSPTPPTPRPPSLVRLDLIAPRPFRALVRWPGFPVLLQGLVLLALVPLVIWGLGAGLDKGPKELLLFRKTHLTTLVVWGLWWPGMIVLAITFGRLWCTLCPMELLHRVGDGLARRIGYRRARLTPWLRAGWMTLLLYLTLQLLVAGVSIHRVPHATAILLLALAGLALASGLVFRHPRAFCTAFCPASALLSVYGRFTPFQLSKRDATVCNQCETRDCVQETNRYRLDRRSCPSLVRPYDHQASDGCVLCLQCAKVCPHDNIGFGLAAPDAPIRRRTLLRPFEATFVMLALGFVTHDMVSEVRWLEPIFHAPPTWVHGVLPGITFGWIEAGWFLILFPLLVWGLIALAGRLSGHRGSFRSLLLAAATGAAPVVALGHLAKAAAKLSSWGGFLPLALREPRGAHTFQAIWQGAQPAPARWLSISLIGWMTGLALLVLAWRAWRWAQEAAGDALPAARAGLTGAALLLSAVVLAWSWPVG